ncbi:glycosyl transferase family 90 [bacterium]|nr:glycosyl transferase family 90 [bacterium]
MNKRYMNFKQQHFTAGDEEQFETHRHKINSFSSTIPTPCISSERELSSQIRWEKYRHLVSSDVTHTFRYIYHKFKKGIFVQIKDNKVRVMLPFSKNNFVNEWSDRIHYNPVTYNSWLDLFEASTKSAGYTFKSRSVHQHREKWYANNGLIRYEFPIHEGDTGVETIEEMLTELCAHRKVPDMEIFINRRDFPILTRDATESYDCIFGRDTPLVSHLYPRYTPILSMCTADRFADIPIPTTNDWKQGAESKTYNTTWHSKKPIAVFRGSSTGLGVTADTNPRLFVAKLSRRGRRDRDGFPYLDAGITKWNTRPRKSVSAKYFDIVNVGNLPLLPPLSPEQQSEFKYIIHIPGHVCAYRLSRELAYGSVILLVRGEYQLWFSHLILPYVHYVPVKADCSDLMEKIQWCKENDEACKLIATNAIEFWNTHLTHDALLDYLQTILVRVKMRGGTYQYRVPTVMEEMEHLEQEHLTRIVTLCDVIPSYPFPSAINIPSVRDFGVFEAVRWFFTRFPDIFSAYTHTNIHNGNRNREMYSIQIGSFHMLCKTDVSTHEYFIGMSCINHLLKFIPNFSYTFGKYEGVVYSEFFQNSITLFEYIQDGHTFKFETFIHILFQIGFILHEAQARVGFVHWDLTPWNVIIRFRDKPKTIQYYYSYNQTVLFETNVDVVIIDYEKSHCVWNGEHYGKVHPFEIDTIHDILTLLITSIFALLRYQTLNKREMARLFILTSFFGGTSYTENKIFRTIYDLKSFLNKAKKFSQLIDAPKGDLAEKTPLSFIYFLQTKLGKRVEFTTVPRFQMHRQSSGEVYARLCNRTYDLDSVVNSCPVEIMTISQAIQFHNRLHIFDNRFRKILTRLEKHIIKFEEQLTIPQIPDCAYTIETFDADPTHSYSNCCDFTHDRMDRITFLLNFSSSFLTRTWKPLLELDSVKTKGKIADVNTFIQYSKKPT